MKRVLIAALLVLPLVSPVTSAVMAAPSTVSLVDGPYRTLVDASANGQRVLTSSSGPFGVTWAVVDRQTGDVTQLPGTAPTKISGDGSKVLGSAAPNPMSQAPESVAAVIAVATRELTVMTPGIPGWELRGVDINSDGSRVAAQGFSRSTGRVASFVGDGAVTVQLGASLTNSKYSQPLGISADGNRILYVSSDRGCVLIRGCAVPDQELYVDDVTDIRAIRTTAVGHREDGSSINFSQVVLSADGRWIVATEGFTVYRGSTSSRNTMVDVALQSPSSFSNSPLISVSADGMRFTTIIESRGPANSSEQQLWLYDAQAGTAVGVVPPALRPVDIASGMVSDDGKTVLFASGALSLLLGGPVGVNTYARSVPFGDPPPTVTSVSPATGTSAGGTSVTISGTDFIGQTQVFFGTVPAAEVRVISPTRLVATTANASVGAVDVRVVTATGTSVVAPAARYTFVDLPPAPVTGLTAAVSGTSIGLHWVNPTTIDFAGVTIRRAVGTTPPASPTSGTQVTSTSKVTTSFTDTSLAPNTTYSYAVFARDTASNHSSGVTRTATTVTADLTAPAPVTGLTASVSGISVGLNWANPTTADFFGVSIRRNVGTTPPATPTSGTPVTSTSKATSSFVDAGLSPNTTYAYAFFARDASSNFAPGVTRTVATTTTDVAPPGPIKALTSAVSGTAIGLHWTNPTTADFFGVTIRRAVGTTIPPATPTSGTAVVTTSKVTTSFVDAGLSPNTTYAYAIFARDVASNHSPGFTKTATTATTDVTGPAPVTDFTVEVTGTSIGLLWGNPSTADFFGVTIRRAVGSTPPATPTSGTPVTSTSKATNSFTDGGLAPNTTYSYAVFARDVASNYAPGVTASATSAG